MIAAILPAILTLVAIGCVVVLTVGLIRGGR